jgi:hypothetical protein
VHGLRKGGRNGVEPSITVVKASNERYKMNFQSDDGSIVGTVTVKLPQGTDFRSAHEKRQAAVAKLKALSAALCETVENLER